MFISKKDFLALTDRVAKLESILDRVVMSQAAMKDYVKADNQRDADLRQTVDALSERLSAVEAKKTKKAKEGN